MEARASRYAKPDIIEGFPMLRRAGCPIGPPDLVGDEEPRDTFEQVPSGYCRYPLAIIELAAIRLSLASASR